MSAGLGLSLVFFALYVLIAVIIGALAAKKETEDEFMIAARKVGGIQMIATMTAGVFDGAALSIYIAYVYQFGFSAIWFFLGISLGFILFRHFSPRIKARADQLGVYSMPEYFYCLLGRGNALMFSVFLVIQFFVYLVVNFIISGKVLVQVFPGLGYAGAVAVGGGIILTYLLMAGFKAVVKTDLYQFLIMILMAVSVGLYLVKRSEIHNSDLRLDGMGMGTTVSFLLLAGLGVLVAPDLWQRVFAARDEKNVRRGFTYAALLLPLLATVVTTVGLATKRAFSEINPEDALVSGFSYLLPFGLKEFGLVLLYAVALSSSDTVTFVVASIITRDLKNYTSRFSEESMRRMTRVSMVAFVLAALTLAIAYQGILTLAFSLLSLNLALFPVVFGSFFWNLRKRAVFWSLVVTLVFIVVLSLTSSLTPETATLSLPVALLVLLVLSPILKEESKSRAIEA